uniref:Uncharacterized protein n=1 Tax=Oryza meridionalis TaxID=40149 RepID=A0A0E0F6J6_9ORYZ
MNLLLYGGSRSEGNSHRTRPPAQPSQTVSGEHPPPAPATVGRRPPPPPRVNFERKGAVVRGVLGRIKAGVVVDRRRPVVPMAHGDPSVFPCFRTTPAGRRRRRALLRGARLLLLRLRRPRASPRRLVSS